MASAVLACSLVLSLTSAAYASSVEVPKQTTPFEQTVAFIDTPSSLQEQPTRAKRQKRFAFAIPLIIAVPVFGVVIGVGALVHFKVV